MGDVEKPTGTAATEVMGEAWPPESESAYFAKAKQCLTMAAREQKNAQTNTHSAAYTDQEADGKAFNKLAEELHIKAHASTVNAEKWAALSGWVTHMGELIQTAKNKIAAEVKAHEANCVTGKSLISTAEVMKESGDVATHKANVATAITTLETELTAAETACAADQISAPPGGVPKIPDEVPQDGVGPATSDMPATDPTAAGGAPVGSAGSTSTTGSAPGSGAPAQPLPPSAFAASPAAAPSAAAPASMGAPTGASPAGAEAAPSGGMPMSGMPMSGMPQMQPPQMPQMPSGGQTPGNDLAKTVGDTVTKLAGKDGGGTPVSQAALDKLLDAQGSDHDGKPASGDPAKLPDGADDPLKKVFGNNASPTGAQAQAHALDPYSTANQNPSLNNPATPSHLQPPSPAAPVVTAAPTGPASAPMTELSADENYPGPQQHSTTTTTSPSDSVVTHPSAGPAAPPAAPGAPGAPAAGGPQPGAQLGAYNPGALGAPAPMAPMGAPMAPMAPMGGMMAPPAGGGGGSATPVLAAAVPAAVVEAATSGRRRAPEVTRVTSLPSEHAAAERHLAGLLRVYTQRGWATAVLAIACLEGQAGVRYLLATADGLSLVPMGVPLPAGVELLSEQPLSGSFAADWSGHVHPARKLAAWAAENSAAGRLVYLVSNDSAGVPAVSGAVVEVRQTQADRSGMSGGSPATLPRTAVAAEAIPAAKAAAALEAFGAAWGITDATADDDWRTAPGRLWASRWDRDRPEDYPAVLATYHYVEGLEALRQGREADAAYAATQLAAVRPYDWVAASA